MSTFVIYLCWSNARVMDLAKNQTCNTAQQRQKEFQSLKFQDIKPHFCPIFSAVAFRYIRLPCLWHSCAGFSFPAHAQGIHTKPRVSIPTAMIKCNTGIYWEAVTGKAVHLSWRLERITILYQQYFCKNNHSVTVGQSEFFINLD